MASWPELLRAQEQEVRSIFSDASGRHNIGISMPTTGGFRPVGLGSVKRQELGQAEVPRKLSDPRARFEWAVGRLCTTMRTAGSMEIPEQQKAKLFWAYVKNSGSSTESVLTAYRTLCPEYAVPEIPEGFVMDKPITSGKALLSYKEAEELFGLLSGTLGSPLDGGACVNSVIPGDFIQVDALRQDLKHFLDGGDVRATFDISQEDVSASGRLIECLGNIG